MTAKLPKEVVAFLLANPDEVVKLQNHIKAVAENAKWRAEMEEKRRTAPTVPCGTFGCNKPRNAMDPMCESCEREYQEDPDAFK